MVERKLINDIIVSLSALLLVIGMERYFKQYLYEYAVYMIVIGFVVLFIVPYIMKDSGAKFLKRLFTNSLGLLLLVTGFDYFLDSHMEQYAMLYIFLALLLYQYRGALTGTT